MARLIHASASGYFPRCIVPAETGNLPYCVFTLKQLMEIYWKIKVFRLTINGTIDIFQIYGNQFEWRTATIENYSDLVATRGYITGGSSATGFSVITPDNQRDLICTPYSFLMISVGPDFSFINVRISFDTISQNSLFKVNEDTGLFLLVFFMASGGVPVTGLEPYFYQIYLECRSEGLLAPTSNAFFVYNGVRMPVWVPRLGNDSVVQNLTIELEPIEYY